MRGPLVRYSCFSLRVDTGACLFKCDLELFSKTRRYYLHCHRYQNRDWCVYWTEWL